MSPRISGGQEHVLVAAEWNGACPPMIDSGFVGSTNLGGAARAEDAQGTPSQSHISPSVLAYEDKGEDGIAQVIEAFTEARKAAAPAGMQSVFQASSPPSITSEYGTHKTVKARCWPWL